MPRQDPGNFPRNIQDSPSLSVVVDSESAEPGNMSLPEFSGWGFGDYESFNIFGRNTDVDTGVQEDLWTPGGSLVYLAAAETMSVVSTSTDDDGAPLGIGAHNVFIEGLDNGFAEAVELVTLDGTTPVVTATSFRRILRMQVINAGSTESNVGTITATATGAATIQAQVLPIVGRQYAAFYTIPAGKEGLFYDVHGMIDGGGQVLADFGLFIRNASLTNPAWNIAFAFRVKGDANFRHHVLSLPANVPTTYDLRLAIQSDTNNTNVSGGFSVMTRDIP